MELDISNEVIVGIAVVIYGIILYLLTKPKKKQLPNSCQELVALHQVLC